MYWVLSITRYTMSVLKQEKKLAAWGSLSCSGADQVNTFHDYISG
jgi:hypothetical protein